MDLNDDMAKYVILRNMAKGNSISLENISEKFDRAWELCQNDEEAKKLIDELSLVFEKYAEGMTRVDSNQREANQKYSNADSVIEQRAALSYKEYCEKLKEKGLKPDVAEEEYIQSFKEENKEIYGKMNNAYKAKIDCDNLSEKIEINEKFLNDFANCYYNLQLRIQTLEKKDERKGLAEIFNPLPTENKGPVFGL